MKTSRSLLKLVLCVAGLASLPSRGLAQAMPITSDVIRPTPGIGHDYVRGLNETVNPATGTLNINIALPVPASRGLTLPFSITYNSGVVHHAVVKTYNGGSIIRLFLDGTGSPPDRSNNGWSDTIPYVSALAWVTNIPPNPDGETAYCDHTSSLQLYDAKGEAHQLGLTSISIVHQNSGGTGVNQQQCAEEGYPASGTWSANGMSAQVIGPTCTGNEPGASCNSAAPPFTATDLDRTVYNFAGDYISQAYGADSQTVLVFPSTIEDRNGNVIQITSGQSSPAGYPTIVRDTAGRVAVQLNYNGSAQDSSPTSYEVGGLNYPLTYTTSNSNYTSSSLEVSPMPGSTESCGPNLGATYTGRKALQSIGLPNGQAYTFHYDPTYGLVDEIDYPNGGWVKYQWKLNDTLSDFVSFPASGQPLGSNDLCNYQYKTPVVQQRTVGYSSGSAAAVTQQFTYSTTWSSNGSQWLTKTTTVTTTDDVTGETSTTKYTYTPTSLPLPPSKSGTFSAQIPSEQMVQTYDWGKSGSPLLTVNKTWGDPYAMTSEQRVLASGRNSKTAYILDANDRVTEKDEFDFGQSNPYRKTKWTYYSSTYGSPGLSTPCQEIVTDGNGTKVSETDAYYDGGTSVCTSAKSPTSAVKGGGVPPATRDETAYGTGVAVFRGNVTTLVKLATSGTSPTTTYTYDETGQRTTMTDACGNASCSDMSGTGHTTTYDYTDSPAGGNPPGNSNAYLTTLTSPATGAVKHQEKYSYNYTFGLLSSSIDENGQPSSYFYSDPLNRITEMDGPPNPALNNAKSVTKYTYNDSTPSVTKSVLQSGSTYQTSISTFDGIGHVVRREDGANIVDMSYDGMSHLSSMSNPHLSTPNATEDGITKYAYDALGRTTIITRPDGSTYQSCYDGVASTPVQNNCSSQGSGLTTGTWIDTKDEAGKRQQQTSDGFGRLTYVLEPDGSNNPVIKTSYSYNLLNDLTAVSQLGISGEQPVNRQFVFDSLSRLTQACNPETLAPGAACSSTGPWSQSYFYDANGNVSTRIDPKGTRTAYSYDSLNRVTGKVYADGVSLSAFYNYDTIVAGTTPDNPIGRLTFSWTSPSETNKGPSDPNEIGVRYYKYDQDGRVNQWGTYVALPANPNGYGGSQSQSYDLAGNAIFSDVAPASSVPDTALDYGFDGDGRLQTISLDGSSSGIPVSIPKTIFKAVPSGSSPAYSAFGLEHAQFAVNSANNAVIQYDHAFNDRGWPTSSAYKTGAGAVGGAGLNAYSYNLSYSGNGTVATAADSVVGTMGNGSGGGVTVDNLNRLAAVTYTGGAYGGLTLAWTYDSFGNRKSQAASGTSSVPIPPSTSAKFDAQNHVSFTSRLGTGLSYDRNGNITFDGQNTLAYDAENRLCAVKTAAGAYEMYIYDVDGNRIGKGTFTPPGGRTTVDASMCNPLTDGFTLTNAYHLDLQGREVQSYDSQGNWLNTNIYAGSLLVGTYASTYMDIAMTDWLGTRRAKLPNNSAISGITEFISLPFGDGYSMVGGNGSPDTSIFFTGKQHDIDTNLDNFQARFYGNWMGRFMTPDWSATTETVPYAKLSNPQSFNLYAYNYGNPLSATDTTGHWVTGLGGPGGCDNDLVNCMAPGQVYGPVQDRQLNGDPTLPTVVPESTFESLKDQLLTPSPEMASQLAFTVATDGLGGLAEAGAALSRVLELSSAMGRTADFATLAITETKEGTTIVSSSQKLVRPAVRALLKPGEVAAEGVGHAEVTGVNAARQMGLTPTGVAASRGICPSCADFLRTAGVAALSALKGVVPF